MKTLYTLACNDYAPKICELTFPLMERYAKKIGAEFFIIKSRKFPDLPPVYEKFRIYDLAKERGDEWSIYFDADVLIHPDFWDITATLNKDTTCSAYSSDFTPQRFKPDEYFLRDGRFIGKGNWLAIFSEWCRDYYHPLEDISVDEAVSRITPVEVESGTVVSAGHLIDDFIVSRNIARYGLKHTLLSELKDKFNTPDPRLYLWHNHLVSTEQKVISMHEQIISWAQDVYTISTTDGRRVYKPIIQGKDAVETDEMRERLIKHVNGLVETWMGKKIPTLQLKALSSQPAPIADNGCVKIVDGQLVPAAVEK